MLMRTVVDHKIHDDADIALMRLARQGIEVRQSAIHRIDILVIGYIVAKVELRRRIAGGDADSVHSQGMQVVELGRDSAQVAEAIVVAVRKAARINLIEDGVLPPGLSVTLRAKGRDKHGREE